MFRSLAFSSLLLALSCGRAETARLDTTAARLAPAANEPPIADLRVVAPVGPVFPGTMVMLDANGSEDPELGALGFDFFLLAGDPGIHLLNQGDGRCALQPTQPGFVTVKVVVTDDHRQSDFAWVSLNVQLPAPDAGVPPIMPGNHPPVARISGAPMARTFQPGTFTLDAHGSSDPDGDALSFEWRVVDRPYGSTVTLTAAGPLFQLSTDLAGDYAVQLLVTDAHGNRAMADAVWQLTLNGQRCVAPLPQWGFTDYEFDVPLLNADIIRVAAQVADGDVELRLQTCGVPFPYVASQTITWCLNQGGDPETGAACGTGGWVAGAETSVTVTRMLDGSYSATVGSHALDACDAVEYDPATNTLRVRFPAALIGSPTAFDYLVESRFSGRLGGGLERAPQQGTFLGDSLTTLASLPAFNGVSLCSLRP